MKRIKSISIVAFAAFLAVGVTAIGSASAQTMATMPTLYNQSGTAVNIATNSYLPAGTYYLAPGGSAATQVRYYGNGMFYNPTIGIYGGSVNDPNGTAGVTLNYVASVENAPGVPNTGMGGYALFTWMTLAISGLVAVAGLAYLMNARQSLVLKPE